MYYASRTLPNFYAFGLSMLKAIPGSMNLTVNRTRYTGTALLLAHSEWHYLFIQTHHQWVSARSLHPHRLRGCLPLRNSRPPFHAYRLALCPRTDVPRPGHHPFWPPRPSYWRPAYGPHRLLLLSVIPIMARTRLLHLQRRPRPISQLGHPSLPILPHRFSPPSPP